MFNLVFRGFGTAEDRDAFTARTKRGAWALTKKGMTERQLRQKLDWQASFKGKYEREEQKYAIRQYFPEDLLDYPCRHNDCSPYMLFEYVEKTR